MFYKNGEILAFLVNVFFKILIKQIYMYSHIHVYIVLNVFIIQDSYLITKPVQSVSDRIDSCHLITITD